MKTWLSAVGTMSGDQQVYPSQAVSLIQREVLPETFRVHAIQIEDGSAALTDEVGMVAADGVVPFVALVTGNPSDLAQLLQEFQVSVDGAKTQFRVFFLQVCVDHLSGGVYSRG